MDVYKLAEQVDADYLDMKTGNTYAIQKYNRALKAGLNTLGIEVYGPYNEYLGIAQRTQ